MVLLAFLLTTPSAFGASAGEGRFRTSGAIALQGIESATFGDPTVVVFTHEADGLAFDFAASYLDVERDWTDSVYIPGEGPITAVWQSVQTYHEDVAFTNALGGLESIASGPEFTAFLAYGNGLTAALSLPQSAASEALGGGSVDPYAEKADVSPNGAPWWRPDIDVSGDHVLTHASDAVVTLTGDFDVYLFQADWNVGGQVFRTGIREEGPGRATVERNILHFRETTLTLRATQANIHASSIDAELSGTLRLDEATGYYQEEDGARWEANDLPALLQGSFQLHAEAVDAETTSLALQGDLVHADIPRVQIQVLQKEEVLVGSVLLALLLAAARFFWAFYTRLPSGRLLENATRRRIFEAVQAEPGIHVRELARRTGLGWGNVRVNLARLVQAGLLRTERQGRYVLVFPVTTREISALARLRSPTARRIWDIVAAHGSMDVVELQQESATSRQLLVYHLRTLERMDLVEIVDAAGRKTIRVPTKHP